MLKQADESIPVFQNPHLNGRTRYLPGKNEPGFLLIHGFTATTVEVSLLGEFLNHLGYPVLMPLLPGHGTTPEDLNRREYQEWVECVELAYRELSAKVNNVIVGGESMGAVLALHLGAAHQKIEALLLYSPALVVPNLALSKFLRLFRPIISKNNYDDDMPWQGYTVYPLNAAVEFLKLQKFVASKLSDIQAPTAIFHGHFDQTIGKSVSSRIHEKINSEVKTVYRMENSGHVMLLDREFDKIARLSMDFLEIHNIL